MSPAEYYEAPPVYGLSGLLLMGYRISFRILTQSHLRGTPFIRLDQGFTDSFYSVGSVIGATAGCLVCDLYHSSGSVFPGFHTVLYLLSPNCH